MDTVVSEVKSRLDIVDLIGEYVRLTKAGSSFKGLCPFHTEKTPSFNVSEERQSFHCFGCQKGGDAFTFLMEIEGVGFREALKILADRAGVALPTYNPQAEQKMKSGYEVLESATKWYEAQLESSKGSVAKEYLEGRGISEESVKSFRLGFSLDGWNHVEKHLRSLGYGEKEIEQTGLLVNKRPTTNNQRRREDLNSDPFVDDFEGSVVSRQSSVVGQYYDRFRNRIMFPIVDVLGRVIGYSARVLPGADEHQGKYINTPETALYHKSRVLYGIFQAKQAMKRENRVIVVEGQMDVIAMHQSGFQNTVAVSGTAMTEEHIKILKRYTKNITLFFDMDRAGREAAYKSTIACLHGETNVSLVHIPGGKDASELAQSHPEELRRAMRTAKGAMEFFTEEILAEHNLAKSEEKKEAVEKLLPLVHALMNEIEQFDWVRKISERVSVETVAVMAALTRYGERLENPSRSVSRPAESSPVSGKKRTEVLRSAILSGMLISPSSWKKTVDQMREKTDSEVGRYLQKTELSEKMFSLGESVGYDFDLFREILHDDAIIREAQEMTASFGEFDEGLENTEKQWKEIERLLRELEKEIGKQLLEDLVRDIRKADQMGDTATRDALARRFGEVSRNLQSF